MLTKVNQPATTWLAQTPIPQTRIVEPIEIGPTVKLLLGKTPRGVMAPGARVSVDTPMARAQRPFHANDVLRHIIKTNGQIDWNLFGMVTAVRNNKTGEMVIINGQHRISLVKTLDPTIKDVPAHIIDEDDETYIARLFGLMNGGASRPVTREERLWADIVAGEPDALRIEALLIKCGLACGMVNEFDPKTKKPNLQINIAGFEKCLAYGEKETEYGVALIRQAFPEARKIDQQLIGLVRLLVVPDYKNFMDPSTKMAQRFVQWFTTIVPQAFSFETLKYKKYRNTGKWQDGIAYGLAKDFRHWLGVKKYPLIGLQTVTEIYKKGVDIDYDIPEEDIEV